jgi:adenosylhomocysteine nucleosidase
MAPGLSATAFEARSGRLLVLAALPLEVRPFLRRLKARSRRDLGFPAWEFKVGQGRGVAALCGMGAGAARETAAVLLGRWRPEILLSVGFGGALTPELAPGAIILGESYWRFHPDTGSLEEIVAPAPPRPLAALLQRLKGAGLPAFPGSLVTTPYIINKGRQGAALQPLGHPVLDLETSPLADLAAARGLAFLGLRVITDGPGEEIPEFIGQALKEDQKMPGPGAVLAWLGADPRRGWALLHLWRRSRGAARRLAAALAVIIPLFGEDYFDKVASIFWERGPGASTGGDALATGPRPPPSIRLFQSFLSEAHSGGNMGREKFFGGGPGLTCKAPAAA